MFDNEEKELEAYRERLEELPIDVEKLDEAILKGVQVGEIEKKRTKRKRKRTFYSFAAVAVFVIVFVTSIRVSPAFAQAVATIPGMAKIVELIEFDKGIKGVLDNDYYQEINVNTERDNLNLTINGVILDETGMVLSYTLEAPYSLEDLQYKEIKLLYEGEEILSSISYDNPNQSHPNRKEDLIQFIFSEPSLFKNQEFTLELELGTKENTVFTVPFHVPEKVEEGKVYTLNQELEIEKQKLTIEAVTIYPLRVAVEVTFDESNTMELLQFEDMRIEDENGEVWSQIQNGITGRSNEEGDVETYFLQSNYFEQPEKLYLKLNKMQALPKDDLFLIIDTYTRKVLKQPSVSDFEITNITFNSIEGRFYNEPNFSYSPFESIENANGETVNSRMGGLWRDEGDTYFDEIFEKENIVNPLKFQFWAYPNYIEGDIEIELK